ncbi:unnamed protein product, partial [marine sediment metagenome]
HGYVIVNEFLETSKPNIWACGDAIGKHMFKHVANYDVGIAWNNSQGTHKTPADYSTVPHAVFSYPEVAGVGLTTPEAIATGKRVAVGKYNYANTGKGEAMGKPPGFVKVLVDADNFELLGGHIIGHQASVLVHELIAIMATKDKSALPLTRAMHIHPALSEVVERAFWRLEQASQDHGEPDQHTHSH